MNYGANDKLVKGVFKFLEKNTLLESNLISDEFIKVENFENAKKLAFDTEIGIEEYLWTDIRQIAFSKVLSTPFRKKYKELFNSFFDDISEILTYDLKYFEIGNEINSDLFNICFSFAVNGEDDSFFSKLFEAYRTGGWPCGWQGNWPEGKLIVFYPDARKI